MLKNRLSWPFDNNIQLIGDRGLNILSNYTADYYRVPLRVSTGPWAIILTKELSGIQVPVLTMHVVNQSRLCEEHKYDDKVPLTLVDTGTCSRTAMKRPNKLALCPFA